MNFRKEFAALVVVAISLAGPGVVLGQVETKGSKKPLAFVDLRSLAPDVARRQALEWLESNGKADEVTRKEFESRGLHLWGQTERSVLDRVVGTFVLGDSQAASLLAGAVEVDSPAPTVVPAFLTDSRGPAFYRANLALGYARELVKRRVFEEALEILRTIKPGEVVDPAAYFFNRAVAEHGLGLREDARRSILGLKDVVDAPERYTWRAAVMELEMRSWQEQDLGWVARKMDNIERRLELARGGPQTQKIQKEVIDRLDEIIKELEKTPPPGPPGSPSGPPGPQPQPESYGGKDPGPGAIDPIRLAGWAKTWGKLPDKEQIRAMQDLARNLPVRYREVIENYFRKCARETGR